MKPHILIFTLSLLSATVHVAGQEVLDLPRCREMALQYNKEIASSAKQTESARYMVKSYKGLFFPNLSLNGTGLYSTANDNIHFAGGNLPVLTPTATGQLIPNGSFAYFPGLDIDYKVGPVFLGGIHLEQPLYMGGKIRAAYKMSELGHEMAQMNETLTATNIILQTDEAYVMVIKAQEMKKVAEKYRSLLQELYRNVESARKHGLKPQNDVLKVQVKLNESELSLRKAENALRLAKMNLCHYIGKPLDTPIVVSDHFPEFETRPVASDADITARPEYDILHKQVDIAQQQIKLNRSELLPQVGLMGAYEYLNGLKLNNEKLFNNGSFSVMLNVSIPLYHFGERTNKVKAAKARLEQSRLSQENLNEQMRLELAQAGNNLEEARLESELADRSLAQAEENLKVSKSQYDVGLEPLSDHLEAQALWQQAYETSVDARFQHYLSYIKYQKATGTLARDLSPQ